MEGFVELDWSLMIECRWTAPLGKLHLTWSDRGDALCMQMDISGPGT